MNRYKYFLDMLEYDDNLQEMLEELSKNDIEDLESLLYKIVKSKINGDIEGFRDVIVG